MLAHSAQAASGGTLQAGVVERHYRELSAQNELRPQDVMRMLVHYHAYGDGAKVPGLVAAHSGLIRRQIDSREEDEVGRLQAEYQAYADRLAALGREIAAVRAKRDATETKGDSTTAETVLTKLEKPCGKLAARLAERDGPVGKS
jgi:type I restriction enzyme M protein